MPKKANIPADPSRFEEASEAFRKRVPMKRGEWDELTAAEKEHAFMVSEVSLADVITEVWEAIDRTVAEGGSFQDFQETAGATLIEHWGGDKPGRLETIFRTNTLGAYNAGRHAIHTAPAVKAARPYLRFDGVDDDRQTDICADADGTIRPTDDAYWNSHTPPLHFNCRSITTALSEDEAKEEGIDDDPPRVEPDEGFGAPPSMGGSDWEPDLTAYPAEIAAELAARLKSGTGE